ncbi:f-box only protein 9, partial [Trichonephila clavata]
MDNSNSNPVSSSSGRVGSPSGDGSESEAIEEAQDEPSSSKNIHDLENFRLQWKREIEISPNKEKTSNSHKVLSEMDEESQEQK